MTKKIIAIVASPRKKSTWAVVQQFEKSLREKIDVDFEFVFLKDINIQPCRGCFLCLTKGEEYCPHNDDRDMLVKKILDADGEIMATPNYSLQVTAILKNFLDRIAYTFHRPCFFHKRFMGIVTQGATGGGGILKYFKNLAQYTGYIHVPGFVVNTAMPRTAADQRTADRMIEAGANRFVRALKGPDSPRPPLVMVAIFRLVRSMYRAVPDDSLKDVHYFRNNGWFTAGYYYPVRLGPVKSCVGVLVDGMGKSMALKRKQGLIGIGPEGGR
jgi:multimeric flavodoxin WrbA